MTITEGSDAMALAVDVVAFTMRAERLAVLLGRRPREPYAGRWALPGALVTASEEPGEAVVRHLMTEVCLPAPAHVEQLATYASPGRDPRMRVVSVAHLALLGNGGGPHVLPRPWQWHEVSADPPTGLAFDHDRILADGLERLRAKLEYSPLAAALAPDPFTVADLRSVYEGVWGVALDPRNFHRKITGESELFVPAAGRTAASGPGRPAQLFRLGAARLLNPPLVRPER